MSGFITGVPLFVWPLFVLLVFLGLKARRTRTAPVAVLYGLPLFVIMALRSVLALSGEGWIWALFGGAYLLGAMGGYAAQGRWIIGFAEGRVELKGESLTLVVMMVLFWANFVSGAMMTLAPEAHAHPLFHGLFAACVAAGSGSFAGRALRVLHQRSGRSFR